MNNITKYAPDLPQNNTAAPMENVNQGSVAIEASRAVAEAQGKLVMAKRFPRDENQAFMKMVQACSRPGLAAKAFYSYPRGGETVSGPTIRLAEVLARCWGNVEYGIKELSQDGGKSEMQAYAWDLETRKNQTAYRLARHLRKQCQHGRQTFKGENSCNYARRFRRSGY
jgi:hypothetical protein